MKQLIIAILFFLPISVSAQLLNSYGVVEIGASFPLSSTRGAKFAYRVTDSSYYRWIHTNTWVKILESSIDPDTLYLKQLSGTTALVDGDTIDISTYFLKSDTTSAFASYLKRPVGWGLSLLTGKYPFVDSSKVASRYYVSTSPTTIANNYIATSNGTNLVARNLFDNNTYVGILNSKPFQLGQWTTAGRPTGTTGYEGYNTTLGGNEWYDGTRWNLVPKADRSAFTSTRVPFTNSSGQLTESTKFSFDDPNTALILNSSYLLIQTPPTGIASGIRMTSSNTASLAYLSVTMQPSNGATTQFFSTNNAYPGYQVITNNAFGLYHSGAGGMGIQSDNAASSLRFGIGTTGTVEKMRIDVNGVGVFTTPTQELDVNGDLRVRDSTRLPILSSILQTEASGWVKALTIGGGLAYSGGTLRTNIDTASYIKGLGTIGTIPIFSGARIISDSKMVYTSGTKQIKYTGADFFVEDSIIGGVTLQVKNKAQGSSVTTGLVTYNQSDDYVVWGMSSNGYNTIQEVGGNRGYIYTEAKRGFVIKSLIDSSEILLKVGGAQGIEVKIDTMEFSLNKRVRFSKYGTPATTAATLGKTESGYVASFATDGTILSRTISSLADGNGIYSGSATLANHTTRARVPDDGNLFFSQTYNSGADSSFFYFANATSGERYVGLGMTDTASTGGASLLFGNDGAGEMSFELQTIDAVNGNTQIRGVGGDLNMSSSAGNISLSTNVANEVRVTGLVRAKQEAYYEITSTSSPQTFSNDYSDNFVNQGGTQATFTFLFPASPEDGQILSMTWNNAISTLTLDGNGNTITGTAVTTAVAGTQRKFKFYSSTNTWIKIY